MSLKDFIVPTKEIVAKALGKLTLCGLTFNELTSLLMSDEKGVNEAYTLFEAYAGHDGSADAASLRNFGLALIRKLPEFTAKLIALSAGEPDEWPKAMKLPAPIQLDALFAVAELTFEEPSAVKKFLEQLLTAMEVATAAMTEMKPMISDRGSDSTKPAVVQ